MSYQGYYPPPGYGSTASTTTYPPPPGCSPAPQYMVPSPSPSLSGGYPYHYPPPQPPVYQGYLAQDYPPPPPPTQVQPPDHFHCQHEDDHDDCSSFLRGCLTALCFCCVLEECF